MRRKEQGCSAGGWPVGPSSAGPANVSSPRVACEAPNKTSFCRRFSPPLSWRRDPWKEASTAGAWMPDAPCRELATRCLRRSPSGRQAAGLIPRLFRRVGVDGRSEARRARRAMRGGPQTFPRARSLTPRRSRALFLMLSVSQGGRAWALCAQNQEEVLPCFSNQDRRA